VAEVVFPVGGFICHAHREKGHQCGSEIKRGMCSFSQDAERIGQQANNDFEGCQSNRGNN